MKRNSFSSFKISRRTFLKLLGTLGISLPFYNFLVSCVNKSSAFSPREQLISNDLRLPILEDFSQQDILVNNENPLGPSPLAIKSMEMIPKHFHYYELIFKLHEALRDMLSQQTDVCREQILLKPGSTDILLMLTRRLTNVHKPIITSRYDYLYYMSLLWFRNVNFNFKLVPIRKDLKTDLEALAAESAKGGMVYLSNPHLPLGGLHSVKQIEQLVQKCAPVPVVVDEAYIQYIGPNYEANSCAPLVTRYPNLVVVRTFSKIYGLAAQRIGYYFISRDLLQKQNLIDSQYDWGVAAASLAGAIGALKDDAHLIASRVHCDSMRALLIDFAKQHNISYVKRDFGSFFCFLLPIKNKPWLQKLSQRGIHFERIDDNFFYRVTLAKKQEMLSFLARFSEAIY